MTTVRTREAVYSYLERGLPERAGLKATLDHLAERIPDTVIFGGMLREFGLGNARTFNSDIDLVTRASRAELLAAVRDFSPSVNKFGGLRFVVGRRLFDIWLLEDTWAFRQGFVPLTGFDSLFSTTFFGVDAATLHLTSRKYCFSDAHIRGLKHRVLELNLRENPNPVQRARRAIRMAWEENLGIANPLALYILQNYSSAHASSIGDLAVLKALRVHLDACMDEAFRFSPQMSV
jgi:hypothetical protein